MNQAPLAVVIPALNESQGLPLLLADLARGSRLLRELVVVDGGSDDGTAAIARLAGARVLQGPRGRGLQLRSGIAATTAPWLWLLHADVRLPPHWPSQVAAVLEHGDDRAQGLQAWYGELRIALPGLQYRLLERLVSLRSGLQQRPYGDQGLLIARTAYRQAGELQPLALMEDLEFAERFARSGRFRPLRLALTVDARRWRRHGLLVTSWRNAQLRRAWRRGGSASELLARYSAG